ncbi:hypothetical protein B7486_75690, partial [cyanobacterium TDX16]
KDESTRIDLRVEVAEAPWGGGYDGIVVPVDERGEVGVAGRRFDAALSARAGALLLAIEREVRSLPADRGELRAGSVVAFEAALGRSPAGEPDVVHVLAVSPVPLDAPPGVGYRGSERQRLQALELVGAAVVRTAVARGLRHVATPLVGMGDGRLDPEQATGALLLGMLAAWEDVERPLGSRYPLEVV